MRILALVPYPTLGASNRLRVEQYVPHLRERGIEVTVSAFVDDATYRILYRPGHTLRKAVGMLRGVLRRVADVLRARGYDLVLIHRESAPFGPPLVERALDRLGTPYVFDFDDAVFLPAIHPSNRRWAWLRKVNVAETTARARSVITGNEYLAEWVRPRNSRITIIPTPVDTDRHRPVTRSPRRELVLGWVGSSSTARYLHLIDGALATVALTHPILVRVIGGDYANPGARVEVLPYSLGDEPAQVGSFDIGLLPEPDDQWTRGKGAFKGLLYMAAALPVVASRVGVNADVIVDGVTGFIVDDDAGWVAALERLIADPELRRAMGQAGRERVEERYSLRVQAPRLAAALEAIGLGA